MSLMPSPATVAVGDSLLVQATSSDPTETGWNWSSAKPDVASVSAQGWVRALAIGDVDIVACSRNQNGLCGSATIKVR